MNISCRRFIIQEPNENTIRLLRSKQEMDYISSEANRPGGKVNSLPHLHHGKQIQCISEI